jgi:hypothetical protein
MSFSPSWPRTVVILPDFSLPSSWDHRCEPLHGLMVLFCISLTISNCCTPLCTCRPFVCVSFENCLFRPLTALLKLGICVLNCLSSLNIFSINYLPDARCTNTFFHHVGWFSLSAASFALQKLFSLMTSHLSAFAFTVWCHIHKNHC